VPRLTLIGEGVGVEAPKIHNLVNICGFSSNRDITYWSTGNLAWKSTI